MPRTTTAPPPGRPPAVTPADGVTRLVAGALAMAFVGGSVAVSSLLREAPLFTAQALRYGVACLLLLSYARTAKITTPRPRGTQWLWLVGVAALGLVLFNIALVAGSAHAEPAAIAVAVAGVPIILALVGPLLDRRRPAARVVLAAVLVTAGAILVQGTGRTDLVGLVWALVVLGCEAGFTLLAVPVLRALGPVAVSVHSTWIAAAAFAVAGVAAEGPLALLQIDGPALAATAYLAVLVTAVAFVLWYRCVDGLGAGRAGLLTGIAPIAATGVGIGIDHTMPAATVLLGVIIVATGLAVGLRGRS